MGDTPMPRAHEALDRGESLAASYLTMIDGVDAILGVRVRLRRAALALILGASALAGCGGATPGEALRPAEGKAEDVLDRPEPAGVCHVVSNFGEPLVVDWEAHQRADVEEAMQDGVAVVAYDCKSLRLLKGCSVDGSYGGGRRRRFRSHPRDGQFRLTGIFFSFGCHIGSGAFPSML